MLTTRRLNELELFSSLFNLALNGDSPRRTRPEGFVPVADTSEYEDKYTITMDLPGVRTEDVNITYEDGILSIEGSRHWEKKEEERYQYTERFAGRFVRQFHLPKEVESDQIVAEQKDGVLSIEVPKAAKSLPRTIAIKTREASQKRVGKGEVAGQA